jgi:hypothetical protein
MEHKFVNSGRISLIVSDLESYNVGLLESGIILRNIHEFSTQEAMGPGTLFPPCFHHIAWQGKLMCVIYSI